MISIAVITRKVKVFRETDNEWFVSKIHQGVVNKQYHDHFTVNYIFPGSREMASGFSQKGKGPGRSIEV